MTSILRSGDATRFTSALKSLDEALRVRTPVPAMQSDVYFLRARLRRLSGRLTEAVIDLDKAIELDAYFFHAHLERLRLVLILEEQATTSQREAFLEAALHASDVVLALEDNSYLSELDLLLGRPSGSRSLIRPFLMAVSGIALLSRRIAAAGLAYHWRTTSPSAQLFGWSGASSKYLI